ncbi:MAG: metallophosphoesterase family protein [Sulfolobales archaeon]|nr:serine/threonine protein phosphatase [Sulfolobales archaeon]MCX8209259.1 serine/threonine protein phosphatase [Sulfolobales archaeon]MDW8010848.1 metallophosphoesterase family protein [Sulfolobales archaeon]
MELSRYIDRALDVVSSTQFLKAKLELYGEVLRESIRKFGDVVILKEEVKYVFVGDIHGNLEDLRSILGMYSEEQLRSGELRLVFLGDYVDRGDSQLEVLTALLELKSEHPDSVFLLKGNHEGVDIVEPSPHDLPDELVSRYLISEGLKTYEALVENVFKNLHLAVYLKNHFLALHGGLPTATLRKTQNIREYVQGSLQKPVPSVVVEVLWNDPVEINEEAQESPRGAGMLFGRPVTEWATRTFDVKIVVRGHEPCARGYKFNHNNRVVTVFSRTGPPYYNPIAAILEVDTSSKDWYRSVKELQAFKFIKLQR